MKINRLPFLTFIVKDKLLWSNYCYTGLHHWQLAAAKVSHLIGLT